MPTISTRHVTGCAARNGATDRATRHRLDRATSALGIRPGRLAPVAAVAVSQHFSANGRVLLRVHTKAVLVTALRSTTTSPDHQHQEGTNP